MTTTFPHFYFVLALLSIVGSALLFVLAVRVSGKKGYIFLAAACAIPVFELAYGRLKHELDQRSIVEAHPGTLFSKEEWGIRDFPLVNVFTLVGAALLYRSEKKRANQPPLPTSGLRPAAADL